MDSFAPASAVKGRLRMAFSPISARRLCHAGEAKQGRNSCPWLPHSRPQRPRSFWSAPRIATSGLVQRHSVFEWLCKHNRLRPQPIRFVRLDSEHAQSDGKSVNRGLPVLDLARGRDSWCWPKGARPLGTRMWLPLTGWYGCAYALGTG